MTTFIPKTDLEWRDEIVDLFESRFDIEVRTFFTRDAVESIVRQIREEAVRAHGAKQES